MYAITIDFHNTLVRCDAWFELEIDSLPRAFLRWTGHSNANGDHLGEIERSATMRYRELRKQVTASGVECDAVTSLIRVFADLKLEINGDEVETGVREIMREALTDASPMPGAVELVNELTDHGVKLAIVSSAAYHPFLEWCMESFELRSHFQKIVTSADCGIYKSNPKIYQHTLDLIDARPECSLHLGDSHRFDIASASAIGMLTALYGTPPETPLTPEPDIVIKSLGDAAPLLVKLLERSQSA